MHRMLPAGMASGSCLRPAGSTDNLPVMTDHPAPEVTIIVVPRDRFSATQACIDSIYANTPPTFKLILVDAGSPAYVRQYLDAAAAKHGFEIISAEFGLTPNQARNRAIPLALGRYVVFLDNDVMVSSGWLDALMKCADDTEAGIVTPLVYLGEFEQRVVHMAGGEMSWETRDGQRWLNESHRHFNTPQANIAGEFKRSRCEYAEFHCMMIRKSALDQVGLLDEGFLNVAEHIDLCLQVTEAGQQIWFEPAAQITFLTPRPAALSDIAYTRLRWSREWTEKSSAHFARRWQLHPDCPAVAGALNFGITHLAAQQLPDEPPQIDPRCAQTNIQLYEQCIALGYGEAEMTLLRLAYDCARRWLGHLYLPNGRHYLSHLIGVGSLLAAHGAPHQMVAAGLLHSGYLQGVFAADGKGITNEKRQQAAQQINPAIEYWMYLYAQFNWNDADLDNLVANADRILVPTGKAMLIRMAVELEQRASVSLQFRGASNDALEKWIPLYQSVAGLFGMPLLVKRIAQLASG